MDKGTAKTPGKDVADHDENAKMGDFRDPAQKHGQDPEEVAERMGTTGEKLKVK